MKNVQRSVCEFIKKKQKSYSWRYNSFFWTNPIVGSKHLNYLIFKNAAIIKKKTKKKKKKNN